MVWHADVQDWASRGAETLFRESFVPSMFREMADYTSPKPVDPLWYQPNAWLQINCGCGRKETLRLQDFARERGLPRDIYLYQLVARLRCRQCRQRPTFAEVTRWKRGNR